MDTKPIRSQPAPADHLDHTRDTADCEVAYLPGYSAAGEEDPGAALTLDPLADPEPSRKSGVDESRKTR